VDPGDPNRDVRDLFFPGEKSMAFVSCRCLMTAELLLHCGFDVAGFAGGLLQAYIFVIRKYLLDIDNGF
jgi:hypothetical protein